MSGPAPAPTTATIAESVATLHHDAVVVHQTTPGLVAGDPPPRVSTGTRSGSASTMSGKRANRLVVMGRMGRRMHGRGDRGRLLHRLLVARRPGLGHGRGALIVLFVANLVPVTLFGELEFWFATIKVVAITALIVIGVGVLTFGFSSKSSSCLSCAARRSTSRRMSAAAGSPGRSTAR